MSISTGVIKERDDALTDVSELVNEYGEEIEIYVRSESNVTRDKYNSIVESDFITIPDVTYKFKAFPIEHNPNRAMLEKAGIREQCESIAWLSSKDLISRGLDFDKLENEKITFIVDGNNYGIRDKVKNVHYADAHLYWVFGLFKK